MKLLLTLLFSVSCYGQVLVIDSGYPEKHNLKLCEKGHKNYTNNKFFDEIEHGTNIIGIISKAKRNFCITSYKVFTKYSVGNYDMALTDASFKHFKVVNLSLSGMGYRVHEKRAIERMLIKGAHVVVAAGNNNLRLNKGCNIFPACYKFEFSKYKNFHVVGARGFKSSNFGDAVTVWENGTKQGSPPMSGTSQAAANFSKRLAIRLFK